MLDTLLLHVGYPKTGTTTLQESLFRNAQSVAFLGKSVDLLPPYLDEFRTLINYGTYAHVRTSAVSVCDDILAEAEARSAQRALISLEGLTNPFVDTHYTQPKDVFRKLSDIRTTLAPLMDNGIAVRLLVTVRRQSELLPSLFSQIYLQGFASGLFGASYDSFLDFLLDDEVMGFGPDFRFDAFLDHCCNAFGSDSVYCASMKGVLSGNKGRDSGVLSDFVDLDEARCIELIGTTKRNVRNAGASKGRRLLSYSPGVERFQNKTGISVTSKAFGAADRFRIMRGRPVFWKLPDRTSRIETYYSASNRRLADTYGVVI